MVNIDYTSYTVADLRKEAGRRGVGSGVWRAGAGRDALLGALNGDAPAEVAPPAPSGLESVMAAALAPYLKTQISKEEFEALFDSCVEQSERIKAQAIEIESLRADLESGKLGGAALRVSYDSPMKSARVDGLMHKQVPQIIRYVAANIPLWVWGAPGWGKTTLAHQVGKALRTEAHPDGLPVTIAPIDPTTTPGKLLGFMSLADGRFVPGWFYQPYKSGGLLMLDEADAGDAGILAGCNSLLANDSYLFPNGETVQRHPDFRVICGANTKGNGPTAGFTARTKLDAATLDRFAVLELLPDDELESAVAAGICPTSAPWVSWVQKVRKQVGASVLISPRASYSGAKALAAGIPSAEVADAVVFKLCSEDTKANILRVCGAPPSC